MIPTARRCVGDAGGCDLWLFSNSRGNW
jgi:hypothetical protein